MKEYFKAIILEQINRGLRLKELIPHPLKYSELSSLADRCSRTINDNIQQLKFLLEELDKRDENDIRDIFRGIRRCVREIELIEYFGISALYYETPEIEYLNKLVFRIHQEINLPLTPPSVACISTKYYYFHPFTNVIFVPVGESRFLLHLPDMFHEIGHEVLLSKENEIKLKKIDESYSTAIKIITDYYQKLLTRKARETGPKTIPLIIAHIHSQWKTHWINEFFSDLFALYTLGPAYAWSHFHLTTKKSEDVYEFSQILPQSHPSDDSRMRMLVIGLEKLGFKNEVVSVLSKWNDIPLVVNTQPVIEYQYAYPNELMNEIAELFLMGLRESEFSIVSPEKLERQNADSIINLLNETWEVFWNDPNTFRNWEERSIQKLKSILKCD
jgi:hypothetical protein